MKREDKQRHLLKIHNTRTIGKGIVDVPEDEEILEKWIIQIKKMVTNIKEMKTSRDGVRGWGRRHLTLLLRSMTH